MAGDSLPDGHTNQSSGWEGSVLMERSPSKSPPHSGGPLSHNQPCQAAALIQPSFLGYCQHSLPLSKRLSSLESGRCLHGQTGSLFHRLEEQIRVCVHTDLDVRPPSSFRSRACVSHGLISAGCGVFPVFVKRAPFSQPRPRACNTELCSFRGVTGVC